MQYYPGMKTPALSAQLERVRVEVERRRRDKIMKITYFDERLCVSKTEELTKTEYNSRMGDLYMMELGGWVSNIKGDLERTAEKED